MLTYEVDYNSIYDDNVDVGLATVTIDGGGNHIGTTSAKKSVKAK